MTRWSPTKRLRKAPKEDVSETEWSTVSAVRVEEGPLDLATWRSRVAPTKAISLRGVEWCGDRAGVTVTDCRVNRRWSSGSVTEYLCSNVIKAFKSQAPEGEPNWQDNNSHGHLKVCFAFNLSWVISLCNFRQNHSAAPWWCYQNSFKVNRVQRIAVQKINT